MLALVVTTFVAVAEPARVAVAAPTGLGFEDAELPVLQARMRAAIAATGAQVVDVDSVDADCVADAACIVGRIGENDAIVIVDVSRVGSDVEAIDGVWGRDGAALGRAQRSLSMTALDEAPLSPEVTTALAALAPRAPPAPAPSTKQASPAPSLPSLSPSTLAVGAGVVVGVASLAGFALEAGTLEDPRSAGTDKERARVSAWVLLGGVVAGVGGAVAGGLLLPHEALDVPTKKKPRA